MLLALLFSIVQVGQTPDQNGLMDALQRSCRMHTESQVGANVQDQLFHQLHGQYEAEDYDRSYETINKLLLSKKDLDKDILFLVLLMKGNISMAQKGLLQASLSLYGEAYTIGTKHELNKPLTSRALATVGSIYMALRQYDSALVHLKEWEDTFGRSEGQESLKSNYHNVGLCYFHLNKFAKAESYLKKSLDIEHALGDTLGLAISYMDMASLYYDQYMDDKAIPMFQRGLEFANASGDLNVRTTAFLNMAVVEENRKDFKKSLEYRKKFEALRDSAWNRDKVWELAKQENKFRLDLKDNELQLMRERERVQEATAQAQQLKVQVFMAVSILLAIISGIIIWFYRNVRRSNRIIEGQREELVSLNATKNKLFSIIAHDLKSPFVSIQKNQRKLSMAIEQEEGDAALKVLQQNRSAMDRTFRLLDNLLHWALEQTDEISFNKEEHSLKAIVEQVVYDYEEILKGHELTLIMGVPVEHKVLADINMVKVVLRNVIDNAIKFTKGGGTITVGSSELTESVCLEIQDSGCGMTQEIQETLFSTTRSEKDEQGNKSTGLGMLLSRSLIEKNGGWIAVESEPGNGTTIYIHFQQTVKTHAYG